MTETVPSLQRIGVREPDLDARRTTKPSAEVLAFGNFELDLVTGELRREGRLLHLRHQPTHALRLLLERAGELVTRHEITSALWPDDVDVDVEQGLNHCMKEIRTALGDRPESPRFIQTLPRRGYRFLGGVRAAHRPHAPAEKLLTSAPLLCVSDPLRMRVRILISRSSDEAVLWSAQYDREAHEIELLERDAAAGVRAGLETVLEATRVPSSLDADSEPLARDRRFE